jgi:hypothetical protein
MTDKVARLDIWGGHHSMDHIARSHHSADEQQLWTLMQNEMSNGFLVNIRLLGPGEGWGPNEDFDTRKKLVVGHG